MNAGVPPTRRSLPRGLYVITSPDYVSPGMFSNAVQHAILGGARIVQYRDKSRDTARRKREAATLRDICRDHGTLFIINDDLRLAQDVGADGVHLGHGDRSIQEARRLLGGDAIIGASCYNSTGLAHRAIDDGADYLSFGSFYPSRSRRDAERADRETLSHAREKFETHIVASGGITTDNGSLLIRAGADMLAVCAGVFDHRDPESAARAFARLFEEIPRTEKP